MLYSMKKLLFLLLPITLMIFGGVMACNDDESHDSTTDEDNTVGIYNGYAKFGNVTSDSAKVTISNVNGKIRIYFNSGVANLSATFTDVNVTTNTDSSFFTADESHATLDDSLGTISYSLNGYLCNDNKTLYLAIVSKDLGADTLYFSTSAFAQDTTLDGALTAATDNQIATVSGSYTGNLTVGDSVIAKTVTATLTSAGAFSVDLGSCQFASQMPIMNIAANNMAIAANIDGSYTFLGSALTTSYGQMNATTTGTLSAAGTLKFTLVFSSYNLVFEGTKQ